jgi:hypothetical protein
MSLQRRTAPAAAVKFLYAASVAARASASTHKSPDAAMGGAGLTVSASQGLLSANVSDGSHAAESSPRPGLAAEARKYIAMGRRSTHGGPELTAATSALRLCLQPTTTNAELDPGVLSQIGSKLQELDGPVPDDRKR